MKIFFSSLFIIFLATALKAAPCDSPDFNACKIDDEERVIVIDNQENVKITNSSNMKIGSIIFTANNFNLTMKDSALDAYRFAPSNYNYKINISMDNSQLTLRNASSVSMEAVNLSNKSTLTVQGLSLLSIDDFTSTGGSEVKIKSSFGMLSLKKATLEDVYMTAGFLRIQGDVVAENIYKVDPTDPVDTTRDYTDLTAGGNIEIVNKGSLTAKKLQASQVHVISGNLTINDAYEIGALDNKTSDDTSKNDEKIVNINADGIITTINLDMLKL
ncbi:MAG: hypothetical protein LBQ34_04405, partial [Alphaproteobacteria bacterium]|nr:hypothetical protein [Alphaproteobacteria bacterium]